MARESMEREQGKEMAALRKQDKRHKKSRKGKGRKARKSGRG